MPHIPWLVILPHSEKSCRRFPFTSVWFKSFVFGSAVRAFKAFFFYQGKELHNMFVKIFILVSVSSLQLSGKIEYKFFSVVVAFFQLQESGLLYQSGEGGTFRFPFTRLSNCLTRPAKIKMWLSFLISCHAN